ncbi:MAG: monovalent cation/H(+) antiporter subunit G, partial [Burkholderiales bacterium]
MNHAAELPAFIALVTALLVLLGATLALIGSIGLLRLKSFYDRVHAPTMGSTLGAGLILIASMVLFSALELR